MSDDHLSEEGMPVGSPLDRYLKGALASKGYAFEAAGKKYGVDPTLLASISRLETANGTSDAANLHNNVTGMMTGHDMQDIKHYDSIDDSIDDAARNISKNYLQKDLTTIPQIGAVYSPVKASGQSVKNDRYKTNQTWPDEVQQMYTQMGGTNKFFGPQSVGVGANMMEGSSDTPPPYPNRPPSHGEKPPPSAPPSVADADDDPGYSPRHLGGHLGAINA
jgi:hypothetical protein